jgi:hypothetical protein
MADGEGRLDEKDENYRGKMEQGKKKERKNELEKEIGVKVNVR